MSGTGALEVAVEPRNDEYSPDDDRWTSQVATLYTDLHAQVGTVIRPSREAGAKGAVDQVIVALGSAAIAPE